MIIDKLVPRSPHATQSGLVNAYNDRDSLFVRTFEFTPNVATRTTKDQLLYEALTLTGTHKDLKKLEDAEVTAAKAYICDLWTYLQDQQARYNINILAPRRVANFASGQGHNIWSIDELETEFQNIDVTNLPTLPGLEAIVKEMNPVCHLAYPDEVLSLPASKLLLWAPSLKVTEADTLRKSLADNADLFANLLGKLNISAPKLNLQSFLSKSVPEIHPMDYKDYRWLFWAWTGFWLYTTEDDGTAAFHYPTVYDNNREVIDAEGDQTWLTDGAFGYVVPKDGKMNALIAIIKFLHPYYATDNELGCVVLGNDDTLDVVITGNDKSQLAQISLNDVSGNDYHKSFAMVAHDSINKIIGLFPGMFCDENNFATEKVHDGDGNLWRIQSNLLLGGHRHLQFSSSVWTTNYNIERAFFINTLRGGSGRGSLRNKSPKSNRRTNRKSRPEDGTEE